MAMTESCLESSRFTLERLPPGAVPQAFEKFSGSMSNLDWMRTKSGSKWVQEYVDKAGKVVDPAMLDDASNINKAMSNLSSLTDEELRTLGVTMDRTPLRTMGYNLGLESDFERQLALNRVRKGLEKGLTTAATEDTAMLMAKYRTALPGSPRRSRGQRQPGDLERLHRRYHRDREKSQSRGSPLGRRSSRRFQVRSIRQIRPGAITDPPGEPVYGPPATG